MFVLYYIGVYKEEALTLAACILFGGFLGLFDDWVNLRWRYKALIPLFAAIPLSAMRQGQTIMATYIFGKVDFGIYYYIIIAPLIITVVTNTVNQLGGLNGLETICPLIIMAGLMYTSEMKALLLVPFIIYVILAGFNFTGKVFVGNVGTFAVGITLASFAVISNIEQTLLISLIPYVLNSALILLNFLFFKRTAKLILKGDKLTSNHRRSLQTLIAYNRRISERKIVIIIALLVACTTTLAVLASILL